MPLPLIRCATAVAAALPLLMSASMHAAPPDHADSPDTSGPPYHAGTRALTVPKASCGPGDKPEVALQGQVPAALRHSGFEGFNCNLDLIGNVQGDGGSWVATRFGSCAYHDTSSVTAGRTFLGTPVFDVSDPHNPVMTTNLTTASMLDPWESLKANEQRQLLTAINGTNGAGGPEIDVYDLSADCRYPQLLASVPVGTGSDGGVVSDFEFLGHEGDVAPDGLTYYGGDNDHATYYAIDIANTAQPKLLATFALAEYDPRLTRSHGLSISKDGKRAYIVSNSRPLSGIPTPEESTNGLLVLDVSDVQARKPNPQIEVISTLFWNDGSIAQHTIPVTIKGKPYLIFVDEAGSAGLSDATNARAACDAGMPPFPMARIIDIKDETRPKVVSRLMLETHDPANCDQVIPDLAGLSIFTYGSHYCAVDDRDNATALACGYFNSGIRVFDIRNPRRPREIAYFNPPAVPAPSGSQHGRFGQALGADWCSAPADFDAETATLTTSCQNFGFVVLKFRDGVWPFE